MHFISDDDDRARIPVAIVSGFLGSGKTTLINAWLKDPQFARTAVAINEFGEVPLDQHLIDHGDDQTIVMANGCLCCNLAGDMEDAVMRIFSRSRQGEVPSFDRLIIEPSGLSDPAPVAQAILRHPILSRAFSLHPLVVAVDAGLIVSQFGRFPEVRKQIELADKVILTKDDLVEPAVVARVVREVKAWNPQAELLRAERGQIAPERIFLPSFFGVAFAEHPVADILREAGRAAHGHRSDVDHHDHQRGPAAHGGVASLVLTSETPLPWRPLEKFLRDLRIRSGDHLLRMKGLVDVQGGTRPIVIQAVEHVQSVPVELARWPDSDHRTRLVLIGKGLDVDGITQSWRRFRQESAGLTGSVPRLFAREV